jgi:hypothetical protein
MPALYRPPASFEQNGQNTWQLPDVPAPEGMQSLICMSKNGHDWPRPWLGQANLFAVMLTPGWMPARGQELSVGPGGEWSGMYELLTGSDPSPGATFNLPNLTAPAPGVEYYIATDGAWPLGNGY